MYHFLFTYIPHIGVLMLINVVALFFNLVSPSFYLSIYISIFSPFKLLRSSTSYSVYLSCYRRYDYSMLAYFICHCIRVCMKFTYKFLFYTVFIFIFGFDVAVLDSIVLKDVALSQLRAWVLASGCQYVGHSYCVLTCHKTRKKWALKPKKEFFNPRRAKEKEPVAFILFHMVYLFSSAIATTSSTQIGFIFL